VFLSTCQPQTCIFCGCSLVALFPVLGPSQCVRLPRQSATRAGMTAWVSIRAPKLRVIRPGSTSPSSRAMHADHPLTLDLFMGRLCPSGFPAVMRTAASYTSCTDLLKNLCVFAEKCCVFLRGSRSAFLVLVCWPREVCVLRGSRSLSWLCYK